MNRRLIPLLVASLGLLGACGSDSGTAGSSPTTGAGSDSTTASSGTGSDSTPAPSSTDADAAAAASSAPTGDHPTIRLLAWDGFVLPDSVATFTERTGIAVELATGGDAGTLVNKAILTAGAPEGDVLWGLDNTLLSRALSGDADVFIPYEAPGLDAVDPDVRGLVPGHEVTPVDTGDVCINVDTAWFAAKGLTPPASFEDLADPAYRDLLVVENPGTSSPGLAFLLATVGRFGADGFAAYWSSLTANGVSVVDGWEAAYYTEFTGGGGGGTRPIVVSYASSPPAGVIFAPDPKPAAPTTASVPGTCFRQIEFAGILRGTKHEDAARQLIDFMLTDQFQAELPMSNFVYPVRTGTALPELFQQFGAPSPEPVTLDPADIAAHRDDWVETWHTATLG